MKKIILFLGTIIFITLKMPTLAAINCQGRSDCPTGYECVYWDDSGIPRPDSSSDLSNVVCGRIYQEDIKVCDTNSDCLSSEYCFQPPMPTCPQGENCLHVMPRRYCVPKPTVTPSIASTVNWKTQWANFEASNYQVQVADGTTNGRIFKVNPSKPCNMVTGEMVCVDSNPPGLRENGQHYMSLEVTWFEYDIEMRMYIYLYSDGKRWWSDEIRVFNGQSQPNTEWVYFYGKFFDTPIGQDFIQTNQFSLTAPDSKNNNTPVTMRFSNLKFGAFKNYLPQVVTPTPIHEYYCNVDSDCPPNAYCFQPPMPTCPKGQNCLDVMPRKHCVPKPSITRTPPTSLCTSCPNSDLKTQGDANCDGTIDIFDYSLWLKEFNDGYKGAITKNNWGADFTGNNGVCDGIVDTYDYSLWKTYFK